MDSIGQLRGARGRLVRPAEGRIATGVCVAIGRASGLDPTVVRLLFALLAFAGGAGIVAYAIAWLVLPAEPGAATAVRSRGALVEAAAVGLVTMASLLSLRSLGLTVPDPILWPGVLIAAGLAVAWRRDDSDVEVGADAGAVASWRRGRTLPLRIAVGGTLVVAGIVVFASAFGQAREGLAGALTLGLGIGLLTAPWLVRLARERDAERLARIRGEERAEVAARVHDSVLQTLALIQRDADDPRAVTLARRQERELRSWLYGDAEAQDGRLVAAVERAASEVEEAHGIRVEVAHAGDSELDGRGGTLVLAAREAMVNAARHAGVQEVAVFVEADADGVSLFVRDRGGGFDRGAVDAERRGIAESIEARMARAGGSAAVASEPGQGTEVELRLPGTS